MRIKPLGYYLIGTGSWFANHGIQHVMFAWLVTIVLNESPVLVGVAQTALLLPSTLLMLVGGGLTDRLGARKVAGIAQALAVIPPLFLTLLLVLDQLSFAAMVVYAVSIGTLQAFVTPARDALLNNVARGEIQRTVVKVTLIQFVVQIFGFSFAGSAEHIGAVPIVLMQAFILAGGVFAINRVPDHSSSLEQPTEQAAAIGHSILEGARTVWSNAAMRTVIVQNLAIGMCFMGSYVVTIPLLIREVYNGSAADIAFVTTANTTGLVLAILTILLTKGIRYRRRALTVALALGSIILFFCGSGVRIEILCVLMFLWGACGGIGMTMSRTIMQEEAPEDQRGRVMGMFSFAFMGTGPIGALLWGYSVEQIGPGASLSIASALMFAIVFVVALISGPRVYLPEARLRRWSSDRVA